MSGVGYPSLAFKYSFCSLPPTTPKWHSYPRQLRRQPGQRRAMDDYPSLDPYSRSRYDQGIDSKIVIMGNSGIFCVTTPNLHSLLSFPTIGVGKTSLLYRYTQNKFDPKNTTSTSGAFFVAKKVYVNGVKVRLQLWDTAGQERFRSMVSHFATVDLLRKATQTFFCLARRRCIIEVMATLALMQLDVRITYPFAFAQAPTRLCFCTILQTFRRLRTFVAGFKVNLAFVFFIQTS